MCISRFYWAEFSLACYIWQGLKIVLWRRKCIGLGRGNVGVIVNFQLLWQNIRDYQFIRKKGLFWLTVLEVPVHDWLAPLLWILGGVVHMTETKEAAQLMVVGKQKGDEASVPISPSKACPSDLTSSPRFHLLKVPLSSTGWQLSLQQWAVGDTFSSGWMPVFCLSWLWNHGQVPQPPWFKFHPVILDWRHLIYHLWPILIRRIKLNNECEINLRI
jgi:hypothetical protein